MTMRIREAYSNVTSTFKGEVEEYETYVGGKEQTSIAAYGRAILGLIEKDADRPVERLG